MISLATFTWIRIKLLQVGFVKNKVKLAAIQNLKKQICRKV